MPTTRFRIPMIQGRTPAIDPRNVDDVYVLRGRNYYFDSKGPKSGPGTRLVLDFIPPAVPVEGVIYLTGESHTPPELNGETFDGNHDLISGFPNPWQSSMYMNENQDELFLNLPNAGGPSVLWPSWRDGMTFVVNGGYNHSGWLQFPTPDPPVLSDFFPIFTFGIDSSTWIKVRVQSEYDANGQPDPWDGINIRHFRVDFSPNFGTAPVILTNENDFPLGEDKLGITVRLSSNTIDFATRNLGLVEIPLASNPLAGKETQIQTALFYDPWPSDPADQSFGEDIVTPWILEFMQALTRSELEDFIGI